MRGLSEEATSRRHLRLPYRDIGLRRWQLATNRPNLHVHAITHDCKRKWQWGDIDSHGNYREHVRVDPDE